MTKSDPTHLVIVGGGTAGWLAAHLFKTESERQGIPMRITLVESSKVPTIGVGEGTTSVFGGVLQSLGFDEEDFPPIPMLQSSMEYAIGIGGGLAMSTMVRLMMPML